MSGFLARIGRFVMGDHHDDAPTTPSTVTPAYAIEQIRRHIASVASARRRMERQSSQIDDEIIRSRSLAISAVQSSHDDLARSLLRRVHTLVDQRESTDALHSRLSSAEERLAVAAISVQSVVDAGSGELPASYSSDTIQAIIDEALDTVARLDNVTDEFESLVASDAESSTTETGDSALIEAELERLRAQTTGGEAGEYHQPSSLTDDVHDQWRSPGG